MKRLFSGFSLLAVSSLGAATLDTCNEASLRAAVAAGGLIELTCDGTIALNDSLTIATDVTISAEGHEVTLNGNGRVGIFKVNPGVKLTLVRLILEDGQSEFGGGIHNDRGTVQLRDCLLRNNVATGTNAVGSVSGNPARGGAIFNSSGTVILLSTIIASNHAKGLSGIAQAAQGGGIYNDSGLVTATNVQFLGNLASGGDGLGWDGTSRRGESAHGGAIFNSGGTIVLSQSSLSNNMALGGQGQEGSQGGRGGSAAGGAIAAQGGTLSVSSVIFSSNLARGGRGQRNSPGGSASGGALWDQQTTASIDSSLFILNRLEPGYGEGGASADGDGGAIYNGGTMQIQMSTFSTNSAPGAIASYRGEGGAGRGRGGAIHNVASLQVDQSTFAGNQAIGGEGGLFEAIGGGFPRAAGQGAGGAIFSMTTAPLVLTRSTLSGNIARGGLGPPATGASGAEGVGGGLCAGSLAATNITLVANRAAGGDARTTFFSSPGPGGSAFGGGIYSSRAGQVHFATLAKNEAVGGQGSVTGTNVGGNVAVAPGSGELTIRNSILWAAVPGKQCWGEIVDGGNNISSDNSCPSSVPNVNNVDPRLGPLADNGGPTPTMALLEGSPAIDQADPADAPPTDQRGVPRPSGRGSDIGAYESLGATTCNEASLRAAVAAGGLIELTCDGTIALNDSLTIATDVTISAEGHQVTLNGNSRVGIFKVNPGVKLTLVRLILEDGQSESGGAIHNDRGTVQLRDCLLRNNVAIGTNAVESVPGKPARGGAIFNSSGTVSLLSTVIVSNHAKGLSGIAQAAQGGGIYNDSGLVTATNVQFPGNLASGGDGVGPLGSGLRGEAAHGGAIFNSGGTIVLSQSSLSNNMALGGNGQEALNGGAGGSAAGGAIAAQGGTLSVSSVIFSSNLARGGRGQRGAVGGSASGGALWDQQTTASIDSSLFILNGLEPGFGLGGASADGDGGAIYNGGTMQIQLSTFSTNSAPGAIASFRGEGGAGRGRGGAIHNVASLRVDQSTFAGNQAIGGEGGVFEGLGGPFGGPHRAAGQGAGGAIFSMTTAPLVLTRSTLSENIARGGLGPPESLTCNCTGPGGEGVGGGLCAGSFAATNITLVANRAVGGDAPTILSGTQGAGGSAFGGGIYSSRAGQVHFATLAKNEAVDGQGSITGTNAGGNVAVAPGSGELTIRNSILWAAVPGKQCWGEIVDGGNNISSDNSCPSSMPNVNNVDPRLGPLADNGGPTPTMALLEGSPAIDHADPADAPATDQRGVPRPSGRGSDIGAYEQEAGGVLRIVSLEARFGRVVLRGTGIPLSPFRIETSPQLSGWQEVGSGEITRFGTFEVNLPTPPGPQAFFRVVSP